MSRRRKQKDEKKVEEAKEETLHAKLIKGKYAIVRLTKDGKTCLGMTLQPFLDGNPCLRFDVMRYVGDKDLGVVEAMQHKDDASSVKSIPGIAHVIQWDTGMPHLYMRAPLDFATVMAIEARVSAIRLQAGLTGEAKAEDTSVASLKCAVPQCSEMSVVGKRVCMAHSGKED